MSESPSVFKERNTEKKHLFEQLKTPQELLDFLGKNVEYGFVGKSDGKKYMGEEGDMDKEYFLQSPSEVIESGVGVCWDVAELERDWFAKKGYEFKTILLIFENREDKNDFPTHTFLAYEQGGRWIWFEHSFGDHRGIHAYANFESLLADVKEKQFVYASEHCSAITSDKEKIHALQFSQPRYGLTAEEFINTILETGSELKFDY